MPVIYHLLFDCADCHVPDVRGFHRELRSAIHSSPEFVEAIFRRWDPRASWHPDDSQQEILDILHEPIAGRGTCRETLVLGAVARADRNP
jgi:hypothetical protein